MDAEGPATAARPTKSKYVHPNGFRFECSFCPFVGQHASQALARQAATRHKKTAHPEMVTRGGCDRIPRPALYETRGAEGKNKSHERTRESFFSSPSSSPHLAANIATTTQKWLATAKAGTVQAAGAAPGEGRRKPCSGYPAAHGMVIHEPLPGARRGGEATPPKSARHFHLTLLGLNVTLANEASWGRRHSD